MGSVANVAIERRTLTPAVATDTRAAPVIPGVDARPSELASPAAAHVAVDTAADSRSVTVVIPVYNSAATLAPLLHRLVPVMEALGRPYEIIMVNDGSRDASWARIEALQQHQPLLTGIDLRRNYGQHNALLCGIRTARHALVVTLDDDLQHPPEEIPNVIATLEASDLDVVYGVPLRAEHGFLRNVASQLTKTILQGSMGAETARSISAFRVFRTDLRDAFAEYQSPFVSIDVLLTWGTTRFGMLPVRHDQRMAGKSNYTLRKLITHSLSMMTGFSTLPLRIASLVGFAFTGLGFLVLVYVLGRFAIEGGSVAGFPFLASIIAIFSGAQMFALGIIGEYLARMHFRSMERPPYSVRRRVVGGHGAE